eukprot:12416454-Karenia_brevis.AAC.1
MVPSAAKKDDTMHKPKRKEHMRITSVVSAKHGCSANQVWQSTERSKLLVEKKKRSICMQKILAAAVSVASRATQTFKQPGNRATKQPN